jgi:4-amino-4-deoxychorismate lyase
VVAEVNGSPASIEDLTAPGLANYAHYTVMLVEHGRVRGLALHLRRLDENARVLHGRGLDGARVRELVRHAVAGARDPVVVRVTVFSGDGSLAAGGEPDVLVTTSPPPGPQTSPLRVQSTTFVRDLPQVKHVGTFGQVRRRRLARQQGFDDVLLVDPDGRVAEGSTWNVEFFDGERVIWPDAPVLPGVAMELVRAGLEERGIPWEARELRVPDLRGLRTAFLTQTLVGARPLAGIDGEAFTVDPELQALLAACYESSDPEPL